MLKNTKNEFVENLCDPQVRLCLFGDTKVKHLTVVQEVPRWIPGSGRDFYVRFSF